MARDAQEFNAVEKQKAGPARSIRKSGFKIFKVSKLSNLKPLLFRFPAAEHGCHAAAEGD